jgi:hypothetical protein
VLFASSNGYISISKGDKQILLDKNGETVIESKKYVTILPPLYGKCITIGSSWDLGLIDLDGEVISSPAYSAHPRYVDYCRIINVRTHRWRFAEQAQKALGDELL